MNDHDPTGVIGAAGNRKAARRPHGESRFSVDFEVVVVGGGHAGIEAALAASRLGKSVGLVTMKRSAIGLMSCNPAVGGIGKGHLVREIDALGGEMALNTDASAIQFRTLNTRKGPAVRSTRAQCDRKAYASRMQSVVESTDGLSVIEDEVTGILAPRGRVRGVIARRTGTIHARAVVLTTGTFLEALLHFGDEKIPGGRIDEPASTGLSQCLRELGLSLGRLKTGTPPRLLADSLDYEAMTRQDSDPDSGPFSIWGPVPALEHRPCWVTQTNAKTHRVILDNIHLSPLFTGGITGRGPRYCPSIEDKVVRFAHHDSHRVFIEPEGLDSTEVYPNGLSTSLPVDVQEAYVRTIPGMKRAIITRPGYAVEYDYVDSRQVGRDLQVVSVPGLYLAGQVIGTTGYEEAGALGLLAGACAALALDGRKAPVITRADAYLGVMVDDLVTRGVTEPYRMFTSRAEFRLSLREDNAHERLCPLARSLGLLSGDRERMFEDRAKRVEAARTALAGTRIVPPDQSAEALGQELPREGLTLLELLRRPGVGIDEIEAQWPLSEIARLDRGERHAIEVDARYQGYLEHERREVERFKRLESLEIPSDMDFASVPGLSLEVQERLSSHRPSTIGLASRLEGVTPAAIAAILLRIRRSPGP